MFSSLMALVLFGSQAHATCEDFHPQVHLATGVPDVLVGQYELVSIDNSGDPLVVELRAFGWSTEGATYDDVIATLEVPPGMTVVDDTVHFDELRPDILAASTDTFTLHIPVARRAQARAWLRSNTPRWHVSGLEVPTYAPEVVFLDEETDLVLDRREMLPDGREVFWFAVSTALLDSLTVGNVLLPMPDWPGLPSFDALHLPSEPEGCLTDFPLWVDEVLLGDGTNGGELGEVGVTRALTGPSWGELVESATLTADVLSAFDTDTNGPLDTLTDPLSELGQEGRYCTLGSEGQDTNGDGVPEHCPFGSLASRIQVEVAPGVEVSGLVRVRDISGHVTFRLRRQQPFGLSFTLDGELDSSLTLKAEGDVDLDRETLDILDVQIPIAVIPLGIDEVVLSLDWELFAGFEGSLQAQTMVGAARTDQFHLTVGWADGRLSADAYTDGAPWPVVDPLFQASTSANASGFIGMRLGGSVHESLTASGVAAHLVGDALTRLTVDTTQDPWWTVETGLETSVEVSAEIGAGLLGDWTTSWPLDSTASVGAAAPEGSIVGSWGHDDRWAKQLDCAPGILRDGGIGEVVAHPLGGFVTLGHSGLDSCLVRYDDAGEVMWSQKVPFVSGYRGLAVLDDASVVVGLDDCGWIGRFSADGAPLWLTTLTPDSGSNHFQCDILPFTDATGTQGIAVANTVMLSSVARPAVTFLDLDGHWQWSRAYAEGLGAKLHGATVTADGDLVMVGTTQAPAHGLDNSDGYFTAPDGGLMMRVDPAGEVKWATSINVRDLTDVAEGADGRLVATGRGNGYIYHPRHLMPVVAVDADGELMWSMTYAEDVVWEGRVDSSLDRTPGDTAWDEGVDIEALGDGTFVVLGESSLGADQAVWLMRITQDGDPLWFWMHDGPLEDRAMALAAVPGGILTAGQTKSLATADGETWSGWLTRRGLDGGIWPATSQGWTSRSLQPELNDTRDTIGVFAFHEGGQPYDDVAEPFTMVEAPTFVEPVDGDAMTVDVTW